MTGTWPSSTSTVRMRSGGRVVGWRETCFTGVIITGRALNLVLAIFAGGFGEIVHCRGVGLTLISIAWEDRCLRGFTTKRALLVWACASHVVLILGRTILV